MKKISFQSITRIADVFDDSVSVPTYNVLQNFFLAYRDTNLTMSESLIDIGVAEEEAEAVVTKLSKMKEHKETVLKEIKVLADLARENDIAYLRFISHV